MHSSITRSFGQRTILTGEIVVTGRIQHITGQIVAHDSADIEHVNFTKGHFLSSAEALLPVQVLDIGGPVEPVDKVVVGTDVVPAGKSKGIIVKGQVVGNGLEVEIGEICRRILLDNTHPGPETRCQVAQIATKDMFFRVSSVFMKQKNSKNFKIFRQKYFSKISGDSEFQ